MKTCTGKGSCGQVKSLDEFYYKVNVCKECHKARIKARRAERADYYKAFDRDRANNPDRVAARAAYKKTDNGRARVREGQARYIERYPEKQKARTAVSNAIRDGHLTRRPCEECNSTPTEAHHDSYAEADWLRVRWLCVPCHVAHHVAEREVARNA